jgi:membrane-associated phospholipid phosphatase
MSRNPLIDKLKKLPAASFIIGYALLLCGTGVLLLALQKPEFHLLLNSRHTPFSDILMKYWTYIGDGLLLGILVVGLTFVSMRFFLTGLTALALGGLMAQFFKRVVFSGVPRPVKYFEIHHPDVQLNLVEGVNMHMWFSFPSGHAAAAFAVFFSLALMTRSAWMSILFLLLASGVAFSRVYLSQHFLEDVAAGSLLGMGMGWLAWLWIKRYRGNWLGRSLPQIIKR